MNMSTRVGLMAPVTLLTACGGGGDVQRDESKRVIKAGEASVFELELGDCLSSELGLIGDAMLDVPLLPWDLEHTHELFFKAEHPEGPDPGSAASAAVSVFQATVNDAFGNPRTQVTDQVFFEVTTMPDGGTATLLASSVTAAGVAANTLEVSADGDYVVVASLNAADGPVIATVTITFPGGS